jgi:hypothetical protein
MWEVMTACVIMHNMVVEDERVESIHDQGWQFQRELIAPHPGTVTFKEFLQVHDEIRDCTTHDQKYLIEHQWALVGMEEDME